MSTRLAAVAVVLALAVLAAYTVFSGPTTVAVKLPGRAHSRTAAPAAEPGAEPEQGERGD